MNQSRLPIDESGSVALLSVIIIAPGVHLRWDSWSSFIVELFFLNINSSFLRMEFTPEGVCLDDFFIIKKTWPFAFNYAQSRISLVFCPSLVFLFLCFLTLQLNQIWWILCVGVWNVWRRWGGRCLFVKTISHWYVWIYSLLCTTLTRF